MPRSPLTLAAAASAAVPGADILGARSLTDSSSGRYDCAVVTTPAEIELLVRIPTTNDAALELAADAKALHALTDGARALLPFAAPHFVNFVSLATERAGVFTFLPGYQLAETEIPAGAGAATSIGAALAAIHALPASVVRQARLRERTAVAVREEVRTLIDRTARTSLAPRKLIERWRLALGDDALWQFEPAVTLGGAEARSFVFGDSTIQGVAGVPVVTGVRGWHGLAVGDPAIDLAWLNTVGDAAEYVRSGYAQASARHPDSGIEARARLLSELALAKWLVYGVDTSQQDIIDDAQQMLADLVSDPNLAQLHTEPAHTWSTDEVLGVSDEVLSRALVTDDVVATSMQTDAFDRDTLGAYFDAPDEAPAEFDIALDEDTQPISPLDSATTGPLDDFDFEAEADSAEFDEAQRAAEAALKRWRNSSSE